MKTPKPNNIGNFWYAFTMLAIWDPDKFPNKTNRDKHWRLFFRTKGIVLFDRALNGESLKV